MHPSEKVLTYSLEQLTGILQKYSMELKELTSWNDSNEEKLQALNLYEKELMKVQ